MVSSDSLMPPRPTAVPDVAIWNADRERWEVAAKNDRAGRHGQALFFRPDGTLQLRCHYTNGGLEGPFVAYHPNGQVSRQGTYIDGEVDGAVTAYASDAPTDERLRPCCVPTGAWELRSRYERGSMRDETFYNRDGQPLLSDGRVRPERPSCVPDGAHFEEFSNRWGRPEGEPDLGPSGLWRWWTSEGALLEETNYEGGRKVRTVSYDDKGVVREDTHFEGDGVRTGAYYRRFVDQADSPYADARVRQERGAFYQEQPVGLWVLLDVDGQPLHTLDKGNAFRAEQRPDMAVFDDEDRAASQWTQLAQALRQDHRVRESLCALGRATAENGNTAPLLAALADVVVPLGAVEAARRVDAFADRKGDNLQAALNELVSGVDPAAAFRSLASLVVGAPRAARDFVEVAILLAPDRPLTYVTRGLIRVELGDERGALVDAAYLDTESQESAAFIRDYVRLLFPEFSFWPDREVPSTTVDTMPDSPAQPLSAVRHAIAVYATRMQLLRAALKGEIARLDARLPPRQPPPPRSWIPPDLSFLLPEGPITLRRETAQIIDETDTGHETTEVKIDESLDPSHWLVPALLRAARANWNGLCWLCWSAGLADVGLPETLNPPQNFAVAAGMAVGRYWRAQDAVATSGLRAMTAGVPGFVWEGLDIVGIPHHFAQMAVADYLEMRSVFLFLASPENLSPFQSDLREA